jgi:hypothetical protein
MMPKFLGQEKMENTLNLKSQGLGTDLEIGIQSKNFGTGSSWRFDWSKIHLMQQT